LRRLLRYGIGWTAGGITPDKVAEHATQVHRAWGEAGRYGKPRIVALAYFSLGAEAEERSYGFLRRYYAFGGKPDVVASRALRTAEALKNALTKYADAGVDELISNPQSLNSHNWNDLPTRCFSVSSRCQPFVIKRVKITRGNGRNRIIPVIFPHSLG
jgi:alkanesulfonate monooxygenase SsuD/methylene tetrahydromethanopterin reductase-like flavin-dependent oxidoreductase (luciferase family)